MKSVFLFFLVNIISVIGISSAMGTRTFTGIIIAFLVWGLFLRRMLFKKTKN
jgi:UPF0716 family protein affecting phage T7 exclusion